MVMPIDLSMVFKSQQATPIAAHASGIITRFFLCGFDFSKVTSVICLALAVAMM